MFLYGLVLFLGYEFTHLRLSSNTEAYDALDPTGNITIKWDIISWTADGYLVRNF